MKGKIIGGAAVVAVAVLMLSIACTEGESGGRWSAQRVASGNRDDWNRAVADLDNERKEVVRGLVSVIENPELSPEDRLAAVGHALSLDSPQFLQYCVNRLTFELPIKISGLSQLWMRRPLAWAARKSGWAVFPLILRRMEKQVLGDAELKQVSMVLLSMSSRGVMGELVSRERARRRGIRVFVENVNALEELWRG